MLHGVFSFRSFRKVNPLFQYVDSFIELVCPKNISSL